MKRKLSILGASLVVLFLVFGLGFYAGLKSWNLIFPGITDLTMSTADLMPLQMHIEQLDRGDNEALRASLNLELDGQIIKTYQLLKESKDQGQIDKTSKWLRKIARHRALYPATYPASVSGANQEKVVGYVNSILSEFLAFESESDPKMKSDD